MHVGVASAMPPHTKVPAHAAAGWQSITQCLPCVQVLQTLSILIQNIRSETAIFYLFSNNFINELITLRFDFEDDEVLGYFVNMLKAISLKLTQTTVQVRSLADHHCDHLSADPAASCRPRGYGIIQHLRGLRVCKGCSSSHLAAIHSVRLCLP
jgi:hypothetical protein